jgi:cytoskeletal protein CcmA (bactofilin family)
MKKTLFVSIFLIFYLFLFPKGAAAQCGGQGCKFYYGNTDCSIIWGAGHSCYPWPGFHCCGQEDCQGPNSDRCQTKPASPTPTPTRPPTPTSTSVPTIITPTQTPTPILTPTPTPTPVSTVTPTPTSQPTPSATPTPKSWFQTQGGDVHSNADLISKLPDASKFFSLPGEGNFPGVVSCLNNHPYFGQGQVSKIGWLATNLRNKRKYDYSYFNTLLNIPQQNIINNGILPSKLKGNKVNDQDISISSFWKIDGDLEVESLADNLEVKIFLVSGKVEFKNDFTPQNTLPVFIANGDIEIDPGTHTLNGVLISDGKIKTGNIKEDQIWTLNGAAISWNIFNLERERENNTDPAEIFVYNPEIFLKLTPILGKAPHLWEEIAP